MPFIIRRAIILSSTQIAKDVIMNYHIVDNEISYEKLNEFLKCIIFMNL